MNRHALLLGFVVVLAVLAVGLRTAPLSSQGLTITAVAVEDALPVKAVDDPLWQRTTAVDVPLSAQMIAKPFWPTAKVKSIRVRALHNGRDLALLLEWNDETRNASALRVDEFRDGVAVQFPLVTTQPFVCMGQQGGNVNIWHWKADRQAALLARQSLQDAYPNIYVDYYPFAEAGENIYTAAYTDTTYLTAEAAGNLLALPALASPVEDMVAGGFGTLTGQPAAAQNVLGYGEWQNGVWRVIFSRSLSSNENDDIVLDTAQVYAVAFAAWDGANGERNGAKATSQWVSLQFGAPVAPAAPAAPAAPSAPAPTPMGLPLWAWIVLGVLGLLILLGGLFALLLPDRT